MVMTVSRIQAPSGQKVIEKFKETGTSNTLLTATTLASAVPLRKLVQVRAHYDGTATQAGITVTFNDHDGAAYDAILDTGSADAEDHNYVPATDIYLEPADAITVACPAGGAVIAGVVVVFEDVK